MPSAVPKNTSPVTLLISISVILLERRGLLSVVKWCISSRPSAEIRYTPERSVPIHLLLLPSTAMAVMVSNSSKISASPVPSFRGIKMRCASKLYCEKTFSGE